jgi:hypothetical protein
MLYEMLYEFVWGWCIGGFFFFFFAYCLSFSRRLFVIPFFPSHIYFPGSR